MRENDLAGVNRRVFLQTGAIAGASVAALSKVGVAGQDPASMTTLPTRKLGKTGVDVTILNQGTWKASGLDRILRTAYAGGIRYFDTARGYGSEPAIKKWFEQMPEVRKNIFLVTKQDSLKEPKQLIASLDERLKALGVDQLDLLFWHAMGDRKESVGMPKSKEFAEAIERMKKSGKVKFVGFSTHCDNRSEYIQAAAEGGFIDAIMVKFDPFIEKDGPLNKSLDAAHKAGIGLISMKQVAGNFVDNKATGGPLDEIVKKYAPVLKERGLTPYQGLLSAIWTDERFATSCVSMRNTDQVRENIEAARKFKPFSTAEINQLHRALIASSPTMCAGCEGQCAVAAGTKARLGDLTRALTYHDHHGYKDEAHRLFGELTEAERNWAGADLAAAQAACPKNLDFSSLLPRLEEHMA